MQDILTIAKAHFAQVRSISIPEWKDADGNTVTIYWKPITGAEQAKFSRMSRVKGDDSNASQLRILVEKAENATGEKLFSIENMVALSEAVDFTILQRIVGAMLNVIPVDDSVKN